jgi:hypothetical protein
MSTDVKPINDESKSIKPPAGQKLYSLWYRKGYKPPQQTVFAFAGELPKAIDRARSHCERMDYRFCGCYPFIVDLDLIEQMREEAFS